MSQNILIHIPHSSMYIPKEYKKYFSADPATIKRNLIALTDFDTDDLFYHPEYQNQLIFPVSRLVCDVERFINDSDEIMSEIGMGIYYTHGAFNEPIRAYNEDLRSETIDRYYKPHHEMLLKATTDTIADYGNCIIVDAHSFASVALPYELNQDSDRPDFCIGTDLFHTPDSLVQSIKECIKIMGYSVSINSPFSGTIVPLSLLGTKAPVVSIMIEVNRKLYMDESTQTRLAQYTDTKNAIFNMLKVIDDWSRDNRM